METNIETTIKLDGEQLGYLHYLLNRELYGENVAHHEYWSDVADGAVKSEMLEGLLTRLETRTAAEA